jgi:hypothetical protein
MTLLRRALLVQGVCLAGAGAVVVAIASYMTANPPVCYGWCLNLAPIFWFLVGLPLLPPAVVILMLAWLWRGRRRWPAVVLFVTDAVVLLFSASVLGTYPSDVADPVPALGLLPVALMLPAIATTLLCLHVLRPIRWIPILAVSAAACVLLGVLVSVNVIGPVHQEIPGELSLSFGRTVVYEGRDLGCMDYVAGWTRQHRCLDAALVVYRGSGDPGQDQLAIDRAVQDPTRLSPTENKIEPLPVDAPFGQSYTGKGDYRAAGGCLLIIDRSSPAAVRPAFGHCGLPQDYSDIRAHWPADEAYAIGIVYWYTRPPY